HKKEGEQVKSGDVLCEVETDKATMDYESTQEGTLLKIVRGEGSASKVGEAIGIIGEKGEDVSALVSSIAAGKAEVPKNDAEKAKKQAEPETVGPATDARAPEPAKSPSGGAGYTGQPAAQPAAGNALGTPGTVKSSPLARKLAAQKGVDLRNIRGSGPDGRVVTKDVEAYTPQPAARSGSGAGINAAGTPGQDVSIPVSGRRAVIARRLSESKFSAPHYYLKASVEMERVIQARNMLNSELPEKVSFNAFIIKFAAEALKRHPNVNASWKGDQIVQFGSIDIALAVDLGQGLITPVVRNCGNRGVADIDRELKELIKKAGTGQLKPEEYTGAGFTISNLGSFGIEEFTAIINPPGSAILAIGELRKTPVVDENDLVVIRQIMKMTLSCDHRVIDGAAGGRFLNELRRAMENPVRVLY
ncbi:MAG TPA: dihydrolipoamide acetyltransferase family protein, partial [Spirochaetia bacterium]|nr:dihydrolipoamide acetyltransferase family protein [Spirochaetia bacterium]